MWDISKFRLVSQNFDLLSRNFDLKISPIEVSHGLITSFCVASLCLPAAKRRHEKRGKHAMRKDEIKPRKRTNRN